MERGSSSLSQYRIYGSRHVGDGGVRGRDWGERYIWNKKKYREKDSCREIDSGRRYKEMKRYYTNEISV